jgi:hypothetical protein
LWEDATRSLHPIDGVPGAATLGRPVNLGAPLSRVAIAPGRRFGIGQETGADNLLVIRLDGSIGSASRSELPDGNVFFSPSADTVAVATGDRVEVWSDIQTQPRRMRSFDSNGSNLQQVFVSDDGNQVLTLSSGSLFRLNSDGPAELIGEGYRDLTFLKRSHDAIAAHSARGIVMLRKGEAGSEEVLSPVTEPLAIALSSDEQRIAVLLSESVVLIDRQSQESAGISLGGIAASGMRRAQGNAVFQLIATAANEIWFLDADSGSPRLVAVTKGELQ